MTVGLLSVASFIPFNGGKSQINLNTMSNSVEYPFANAILGASDWIYSGGQNKNGAIDASVRDVNGMPMSIPGGGSATCTTFIPSSLGRPGNYVLRTTGNGSIGANNTGTPLATGSFTGVLAGGVLTVSGLTGSINKGQALVGTGVTAGSCIGAQISGSTYQINNYLTGLVSTQSLASVAMTTSNGNLTVSGTGRYVWYPGDHGNPLNMSCTMTPGSPYISQYALMHVDDEMAWVLDPLALGTQFKSILKTGRWGAIRDVNWGGANVSNATTWATRKPTSYFTFGADEIRPSLFVSGGATHSSGSIFNISSITWATNIATVVTSSAHGQTGTFQVAIDGNVTTSQTQPTFNGTFLATVVDTVTFTYPLPYTPTTPTTLGTANIGVYDYAATFNDPTYGNGAPQDKQTILFYFDHLACANANFAVTFSGTTTCNWSGHTFVGGERVTFSKQSGNSNLPNNIGPGQVYFVLSSGIVAGTSFQFSLTAGGAAVTFTGATGNQTGSQVYTLNLNATGAVSLLSIGGGALVPATNYSTSSGSVPSPLTKFGQTCFATAVFDATLNAWLVAGGNLAGASGLRNGVPPEAFLKVCKEVGAHPQFALPVMALDNMTDYVPQLFTLVRNTVSWMIPRFECGNEVWNSNTFITGYARALSFAHWNTQFSNGQFDEANWIGKVTSTAGQVLAQMAGSVGNGYRVLIGAQTVSWTTVGSNGNSARFVSTNYVSQSQSAQTLSVPALSLSITFSKSAAYLNATHAIGANYLNPANWNTFDPTTFIANYALFSGSVAAGILTISSSSSFVNSVGAIVAGQTVTDYYGQIPTGTTVLPFGTSGTTGTGGAGTYALSNSFTLISTSLVAQNATATTQINLFTDALNGAASNYNNAKVLSFFTNMYNYAQTLTNNAGHALGGTCYEGGYGPDYIDGATHSALYEAAKYASDLGLCLTKGGTLSDSASINGNYADLIALGVDFPSAYTIGGNGNAWTVCDPDIYVTSALPSFTAIAAFNAH